MTSRMVRTSDWSRRGFLAGLSIVPFAAPSAAKPLVDCADVRLRLPAIGRDDLETQSGLIAARMAQVLEEIATFGPAPDVIRFADVRLSGAVPWAAADVRRLGGEIASHLARHAQGSDQWIVFGCRVVGGAHTRLAIDPAGRAHDLSLERDQDPSTASGPHHDGCDEVARIVIPAAAFGRDILGSTNPRMIS